MTPAKLKSALEANEILGQEFSYIAQSAFQANEDRARVTSFYLVSVGSFIVALVTAQMESLQVRAVYFAFVGLFVLLFAAGILTLLQLVRLRTAWLESVLAMNQIKDYYTHQLPGLDLHTAFRWTNTSRPRGFAPGSVSHLLALQVNLLCACMLTAASIFLLLALEFSPFNYWALPLLTFLLCVSLLGRTYRKRLQSLDQPAATID